MYFQLKTSLCISLRRSSSKTPCPLVRINAVAQINALVRLCASYARFEPSSNSTEQLRFQYKLAFLVLLTCFVGLVIFPAHRLVTLLAEYIPHHMPASSHISLHGLSLLDIDHCREQERFAVLSPKIAAYYVVEVGEVGFTVLRRVSAGSIDGRDMDGGTIEAVERLLTLQPKIFCELR